MKKCLMMVICIIMMIFATVSYAEDVKIMMPWYPSADWIPYVTAIDKGFYTKRNINVELLSGGIGGAPETVRMVSSGKVQFGSVGASHAMAAMEKGANIISIMSLIEKAGQGIYYKRSQVEKPKDLIGKNILMAPKTTRATTAKLFMIKNGLQGKMNEVVTNNTARNIELSLFLAGKVDALPSALFETKALFQEVLGNDMGFFSASDYGVNIIYVVMITNPNLIVENPKLVHDFVTATREGLDYSIKHIDESVGYMEKRYPEVIKLKYRESWPEVRSLIREKKTDPIGYTHLKNWQSMKDDLVLIKFIEGTVDPKKCFTNRFIKNDLRGK